MSLIALALLSALLLTSCGFSLHKITTSGDEYFDKWTDTSYLPLPASYEPISRGEEYGKVDLSGMKHLLYKIEGLSPLEYLCSTYGDVYYNKEITVPLFADWNLGAVYVCTNTAMVVSELSLRPDNEVHASVMTSFQTALVSGQNATYPSYLTPEKVYMLRFASDDVPGLYYSVKLVQYGEDVYDVVQNDAGEEVEINLGRCFLYDRYSDRFVAVDDTVFRLLDGEEVTLSGADGEAQS